MSETLDIHNTPEGYENGVGRTTGYTQRAIGENIQDWSWLTGKHPAEGRRLITVPEGITPRIIRLDDKAV